MKEKTSGKAHILILAVLILIQCIYMTWIFAAKKNGLQPDETLGYGAAERYRTPLYDMLWQAVCSVFPGKLFTWCGFFLNLACFVSVQVSVWLLVKGIADTRILALFTCAFYGFTTAALSMVVYLRMYALLTCLTLWYLVLLQRLYRKQFKNIYKELPALCICIVLGGCTHYFFYIFAFFMTACLCLYLLIQKRYIPLAGFACTSLLGAGIGIALCPSCMKALTDTEKPYHHTVDLPFWNDLEYCLDVFSGNTLGMDWYIDRFLIAELLLYLLVAFICCALIYILFRKDRWFFGIKEKVHGIFLYLRQNCKQIIRKRLRAANWFFVSMLLSVFAALTVISRLVDVFKMMEWCDRYLFFLMPVFVAAVIYGMYLFLKLFFKKKTVYGILTVMACLVLLLLGQIGGSHYL